MMNNYGEKEVKKAFDIVKTKHTSNPRRTYAYVKGIVLRNEEEKRDLTTN